MLWLGAARAHSVQDGGEQRGRIEEGVLGALLEVPLADVPVLPRRLACNSCPLGGRALGSSYTPASSSPQPDVCDTRQRGDHATHRSHTLPQYSDSLYGLAGDNVYRRVIREALSREGPTRVPLLLFLVSW